MPAGGGGGGTAKSTNGAGPLPNVQLVSLTREAFDAAVGGAERSNIAVIRQVSGCSVTTVEPPGGVADPNASMRQLCLSGTKGQVASAQQLIKVRRCRFPLSNAR